MLGNSVKKKKIHQPCDLLHKPQPASVHGPAPPSLALPLILPFHLCRSLPGPLGELGRDMTESNTSAADKVWSDMDFLTHVSDPVCLWSLSFGKMRGRGSQ